MFIWFSGAHVLLSDKSDMSELYKKKKNLTFPVTTWNAIFKLETSNYGNSNMT